MFLVRLIYILMNVFTVRKKVFFHEYFTASTQMEFFYLDFCTLLVKQCMECEQKWSGPIWSKIDEIRADFHFNCNSTFFLRYFQIFVTFFIHYLHFYNFYLLFCFYNNNAIQIIFQADFRFIERTLL